VVDTEAALRRAIESLSSVGSEGSARARKNVQGLAEKVLAARLRQRRARLSQEFEQASRKDVSQDIDAMKRSIAEMEAAGVAAILDEFGVHEP
jgi:hypothetical protein